MNRLFNICFNIIYTVIVDKCFFYFKDANNTDAIYDVHISTLKDSNGKRKTVRYFKHQLLKYIWDENENVFKFLQGLDNGTTTLSNLLEKCHGLTSDEYENQYV